MTNEDAIKELINLEFYGRPFDNSVEASIEANNKIEAVRLAIKALENERPQGEWITIDAFVVKCSVCGVESFATPFCPRCGADMRGDTK